LQQETEVAYDGGFHIDFAMVLRERRAPSLLITKYDAIDIEGNIIALGKKR
jgi:hypothetical protein